MTARLKPNSITLAGSKLVADRFEAGRRPASNLSATSFEPDSVMEFGFEPVCDQLRTSFEPASVMEFGFYGMSILDTTHLQSAQKKNNALFFAAIYSRVAQENTNDELISSSTHNKSWDKIICGKIAR